MDSVPHPSWGRPGQGRELRRCQIGGGRFEAGLLISVIQFLMLAIAGAQSWLPCGAPTLHIAGTSGNLGLLGQNFGESGRERERGVGGERVTLL